MQFQPAVAAAEPAEMFAAPGADRACEWPPQQPAGAADGKERGGAGDASGKAAAAEGGAEGRAADVRGWDVTQGPRKDGLQQLTMALPALTRVFTSTVGGAAATAGYAVGKAAEVVGVGGKAVDSPAFRAGFTSWMWSNGIFPSVQYEPLGDAGAKLAELYGLAKVPAAEDISITPMIVSNHMSYLDGLVLASVFGAPKIVSMAGARKVPVLGKLMEEMDVVFVERGEQGSRQATLDAIADHCREWKHGEKPMLIFPEGTTTNGEGVLEFKRGAFVGGLPVRPAIITYTGQFDPANVSYRMTETGPVKTSDTEWALQFMGHFVHSIHVRVLPPYLPSEAERADPELFAKNCHELMAAEIVRVREELQRSSWKEAAGRESGGLGYRFGDITRATTRKAAAAVGHVMDKVGLGSSCCAARVLPDNFIDLDGEDEAVKASGGAEAARSSPSEAGAVQTSPP